MENYGNCKYCNVKLELLSLYLCSECNTKHCHNCVDSVLDGTDLKTYCKNCGEFLGQGSGLYESDEEKSKLV